MPRKHLNEAQWALIDIQLSNGVKPHILARQYGIPEATVRYHREQAKKKITKDRENGLKGKGIISRLLKELADVEDNEKYVMLTLRLLIISGDLEKFLACSPIKESPIEYNVGIGRVDMLLFHADGGLSIIEAKANTALAQIAGGIGQALIYEQAILRDKKYKAPYINKYLVAPVGKHPERELLGKACAAAGMTLIPITEHALWRDLRIEGASRYVEKTDGS